MAQLQSLSIKGKDINKIIVDMVYPVGSFFITTDSTNPTTLFEGTTWERIYGAFLWGAEDGEDTGPTIAGEKTHTLTVDEIPSHTHSATKSLWGNFQTGETLSSHNKPNETDYYYSDTTNFISATGGGQAHNNMPPYYVTYIWHRTA